MKRHDHSESVFLHPGEYAIATSACTLHTLLGSCVSIVLWHPKKKFGAMSHFILPSRQSDSDSGSCGRYGDEVFPLLTRGLRQAGAEPTECQARIFGGGNMFPLISVTEAKSIGKKNGEMARRQLSELGISVVEESLFGDGYRKIEFDVQKGTVRSVHVTAASKFDKTLAYLRSQRGLALCHCDEAALGGGWQGVLN